MELINQIITVNIEECIRIANDEFIKNSGLFKEGSKYDKMREQAFQIRQNIDEKIDLKGIYSYYEDLAFNGKSLKIKDAEFICNAFEQLDPKTIKGAFVYMITGGEYYLDNEPIMNQLYADIWGTSFAEATRLYLEKIMAKNRLISDSFGPGFYGMSVDQMNEIVKLIDNKAIGIEVRGNGIMLPLKSCGGIVFNVNENYSKLNTQCLECYGNILSCALCQYGKRTEQ